jgi:hypothetical protein
VPDIATTTVLECFKKSVSVYPTGRFLGTRDDKQEGRPYVWKTYSEVDHITDNLARGNFNFFSSPRVHEA